MSANRLEAKKIQNIFKNYT